MKQALINGRIFTGDEWLTEHALVMEAGRILTLCESGNVPSDAAIVDLKNQTLLPGLVDTQVNGGGGALFNDAPTVDTLRTMGEAHRRFGTTGFMPTLISDDFSVMAQGIQAVSTAITEGVPGVLGIHLEGPFLSPERKGVHDVSKFRRIDREALALLTSLKYGKTLVTDRKSTRLNSSHVRISYAVFCL